MSKKKVIFTATALVDDEEYGKTEFFYGKNTKIGIAQILYDWLGRDCPTYVLDDIKILSEKYVDLPEKRSNI